MEELYQEFEKAQKDFHDTIHDYPIFQETLDQIFDVEIKEINDWLDKEDEFYLKKAIDKLKDINSDIKKTSTTINELYNEFDRKVRVWEQIKTINASSDIVDLLNKEVTKANDLIQSHKLNDLEEANKIMANLIKEVEKYQ